MSLTSKRRSDRVGLSSVGVIIRIHDHRVVRGVCTHVRSTKITGSPNCDVIVTNGKTTLGGVHRTLDRHFGVSIHCTSIQGSLVTSNRVVTGGPRCAATTTLLLGKARGYTLCVTPRPREPGIMRPGVRPGRRPIVTRVRRGRRRPPIRGRSTTAAGGHGSKAGGRRRGGGHGN